MERIEPPSELRKINFYLDLSDARTRRNFNLIPKFLSGKLRSHVAENFILKTTYAFGENPEEDQLTESVVLKDTRLFLSGCFNAWKGVIDDHQELMKEIAAVRV